MGPVLEDGDLDTQFSVYDIAFSEEDKVSLRSAFDPLDHEISSSFRDRTPQIHRRRFLT
jgi:hypothetical protein